MSGLYYRTYTNNTYPYKNSFSHDTFFFFLLCNEQFSSFSINSCLISAIFIIFDYIIVQFCIICFFVVCYIVCVCCIISSAPREAFPNFIVCKYNDNKGLLFYFYSLCFFCFFLHVTQKKWRPYMQKKKCLSYMQVHMQTY